MDALLGVHEVEYRLAYRWEEDVDAPGHLDEQAQPTAYVLDDPAGRQVDVHLLDDRSGDLIPLWATDRVLVPAALDAHGTIDGVSVRCMSAPMQLIAHSGYELPAAQQSDVALLRRLR